MIEIPLTKGFVAVVDDCDAHLADLKWFAASDEWPYPKRRERLSNGKQRAVTMHRLIMNCPPDMIVDHKNGNVLDNRRDNLRIASKTDNARNLSPYGRGKSRYRGVTFVVSSKRWWARIFFEGKRVNLGMFGTQEEAFAARLEGERRLWGIHPRAEEAHKAAQNGVIFSA